MKGSQGKPDLLIIFIGTKDFLIVSNYWGVVALGSRSFDYDQQKALYTYERKANSVLHSRICSVIKQYEKKRLNIEAVEITNKGGE